ncbi:MAG TPA: hypothetical protein VJR03_11305 [Nitrospira sp.]|nr:hypothetical protein [Nitrospira sp.]
MFIRVGLLVVAIHLYFLWSLGAGFYYDSLIYAQLGEALLREGGLQAFYAGPRFYVFQHLAPGLPLFWAAASMLAGSYGWVLVAVIQHAIATASLLYLLWVWRPFLTGPFIALAAILVSCNPLYESLHNRLMTESLTGSMLLLGIAATSSLLLHRSIGTMPLFLLSGAALVAIQVRSQSLVYFLIFFMGILVSGQEKRIRSTALLCLLFVTCSVLLWPGYRYLVTGQGFLPNTSYLALVHALRYNVHPSDALIARLNTLPLPSSLPAERLAGQGIDYMDAARIGEHLRANGLDDRAAKAEVLKAAWAVRIDSPEVIVNQLRLPLLSIGMKYPVFMGDPDRAIHRGFTSQTYAHHAAYWEQWEAGTLRNSYSDELDAIVKFSQENAGLYDAQSVEKFERRLRPFLVDHAVGLRDPLGLLHVPSDLWLLGWSLALCTLWKSHRTLVGMLIALVLATYVMSVSLPVGNARYAYPLLPLYTIGLVIALESLMACVSARLSRRLQSVGR